jgi:hypothetical protein
MFRAPVPEASVDEDCNLAAGEDDVSLSTQRLHWATVDEEPEASRMESAP